MKIDPIVEQLLKIRKEHGNIEVTCTGSLLPDDDPKTIAPTVFETTVENLIVNEKHPFTRQGSAVVAVKGKQNELQ
jgi:hypothetical protein